MESNNVQGHESGCQKYEKGFEDGYSAAIKYDKGVAALQARCDRYEKALNKIAIPNFYSPDTWHNLVDKMMSIANEALNGRDDKEGGDA